MSTGAVLLTRDGTDPFADSLLTHRLAGSEVVWLNPDEVSARRVLYIMDRMAQKHVNMLMYFSGPAIPQGFAVRDGAVSADQIAGVCTTKPRYLRHVIMFFDTDDVGLINLPYSWSLDSRPRVQYRPDSRWSNTNTDVVAFVAGKWPATSAREVFANSVGDNRHRTGSHYGMMCDMNMRGERITMKFNHRCIIRRPNPVFQRRACVASGVKMHPRRVQ